MADIVSSEKRSQMMAGIKGKNTRPEIMIRKLLHANGYRFRLHKRDLPRKPDIVLPKHNVTIFVHGCFWHGHSNCELFRLPKSRTDFWQNKISTNKARDIDKQNVLLELGWRILIIRECALKGKRAKGFVQMLEEISHFLSDRAVNLYEISGEIRT